MAEIKLKLSRKPADLHAVRPVTARKPDPSKRAEAQGGVPWGHNDAACCNCWAVNALGSENYEHRTFRCWSCGWYCDI